MSEDCPPVVRLGPQGRSMFGRMHKVFRESPASILRTLFKGIALGMHRLPYRSAVAQLSPKTARGQHLELWGALLERPRLASETDAVYAARLTGSAPVIPLLTKAQLQTKLDNAVKAALAITSQVVYILPDAQNWLIPPDGWQAIVDNQLITGIQSSSDLIQSIVPSLASPHLAFEETEQWASGTIVIYMNVPFTSGAVGEANTKMELAISTMLPLIEDALPVGVDIQLWWSDLPPLSGSSLGRYEWKTNAPSSRQGSLIVYPDGLLYSASGNTPMRREQNVRLALASAVQPSPPTWNAPTLIASRSRSPLLKGSSIVARSTVGISLAGSIERAAPILSDANGNFEYQVVAADPSAVGVFTASASVIDNGVTGFPATLRINLPSPAVATVEDWSTSGTAFGGTDILTFTFPKTGDTITASTVITGTADPYASIQFLLGNTSVGTRTADASGNWTLPASLLGTLAPGTHTLSNVPGFFVGEARLTFNVAYPLNYNTDSAYGTGSNINPYGPYITNTIAPSRTRKFAGRPTPTGYTRIWPPPAAGASYNAIDALALGFYSGLGVSSVSANLGPYMNFRLQEATLQVMGSTYGRVGNMIRCRIPAGSVNVAFGNPSAIISPFLSGSGLQYDSEYYIRTTRVVQAPAAYPTWSRMWGAYISSGVVGAVQPLNNYDAIPSTGYPKHGSDLIRWSDFGNAYAGATGAPPTGVYDQQYFGPPNSLVTGRLVDEVRIIRPSRTGNGKYQKWLNGTLVADHNGLEHGTNWDALIADAFFINDGVECSNNPPNDMVVDLMDFEIFKKN